MPDWLATAENARERAARDAAAWDYQQAERKAKRVNARVAKLGITSITPAHPGPGGYVVPALLLPPEYRDD